MPGPKRQPIEVRSFDDPPLSFTVQMMPRRIGPVNDALLTA
jgi:hypothetical protein